MGFQLTAIPFNHYLGEIIHNTLLCKGGSYDQWSWRADRHATMMSQAPGVRPRTRLQWTRLPVSFRLYSPPDDLQYQIHSPVVWWDWGQSAEVAGGASRRGSRRRVVRSQVERQVLRAPCSTGTLNETEAFLRAPLWSASRMHSTEHSITSQISQYEEIKPLPAWTSDFLRSAFWYRQFTPTTPTRRIGLGVNRTVWSLYWRRDSTVGVYYKMQVLHCCFIFYTFMAYCTSVQSVQF